MCSSNGNFLFRIPAQKFYPIGFVAKIDSDGIALGHHLIAIDEIGQGDSRVLLQQLWLDLIEPFSAPFAAIVFFFGVWDREVF